MTIWDQCWLCVDLIRWSIFLGASYAIWRFIIRPVWWRIQNWYAYWTRA